MKWRFLCIIPACLSAPTLLNGGFESDTSVGSSNYNYMTPTSWQSSGTIVIGYASTAWGSGAGLTGYGSYYCGLQGTGTASVTQTVTGVQINSIVWITIAARSRPGNTGTGLQIEADALSLLSTILTNTWAFYNSSTFTATSSTFVLKISNVQKTCAGDCTTEIDIIAVKFYSAPSSQPTRSLNLNIYYAHLLINSIGSTPSRQPSRKPSKQPVTKPSRFQI